MMDRGFTIGFVSYSAPFRPRSNFTEYVRFTDSGGTVLIAPDASRQLRAAACSARPNETGGLLPGRVLRDADGHYAVVTGCAEASRGAGRSCGFGLSPEAAARLRNQAWSAHPTADVVGWWHSHLGPSTYSAIDLSQQRIWTQPESVGILVFADGSTWGAVYQGPDARPLSLARPLRGSVSYPAD
jgi:proteasome lid subunit RPN8/RPN11